MRVLALPKISSIWVEKLMEIRRKILERRRAIAKIQGEQKFRIGEEEITLPKDEEEDPVMQELKRYKEEIKFVEDTITNPNKTSVVAVMNPEMLPFYETKRAYESLRKFRVPFNLIVINKVIELTRKIPEIQVKIEAQQKVLALVEKEFPNVDVVKIPMFPEEPRGLEWLEKVGGMVLGD